MSKAALFHTSAATLGVFQPLVAKIMPDVEVMHIVEDAMIRDVMKAGGPTPAINARILGYIRAAERAGCDLFMTACSSIGGSVEQCQFLSSIPLARIDEAMVDEAIASGPGQGPRIAVLATVETTLKPTVDFIRRKAAAAGRTIELTPKLMAEAFTALLAGDTATHDRVVGAGLREAIAGADVVVLAQASMARAMAGMEAPAVPVLTSPERGVRRLKEMLAALR